MITIKNNLNQPLTVGERSLAAGGEMGVKATDDDIDRLVAAGHVRIVEAGMPTPPTTKEQTDKTENKEPKK